MSDTYKGYPIISRVVWQAKNGNTRYGVFFEGPHPKSGETIKRHAFVKKDEFDDYEGEVGYRNLGQKKKRGHTAVKYPAQKTVSKKWKHKDDIKKGKYKMFEDYEETEYYRTKPHPTSGKAFLKSDAVKRFRKVNEKRPESERVSTNWGYTMPMKTQRELPWSSALTASQVKATNRRYFKTMKDIVEAVHSADLKIGRATLERVVAPYRVADKKRLFRVPKSVIVRLINATAILDKKVITPIIAASALNEEKKSIMHGPFSEADAKRYYPKPKNSSTKKSTPEKKKSQKKKSSSKKGKERMK